MITWAHPAALWLLIPVALLALRAGGNRLAVGRLDGMRRGRTARLLLAWLPGALRIAGLACLVLAIARPQRVSVEAVRTRPGLDIVLAIDTSGSMGQADFAAGDRSVDRLTVAKAVMAEFVRSRPHDRIGVVAFGEEAFTFVPLTLDHVGLAHAIEDLQIGMAGAEGTAVGTAIAVSAKRLRALEAPGKVVILLTDGRSNAGRITPIEAARAAAALGIRLHTVGVGAESRALAAFELGLDGEGLARVAEATGGRYFRATDGESLRRIYDAIDELEPSTAAYERIVRREERFRDWLIPGVVLLGLQILLGGTWLRRGP